MNGLNKIATPFQIGSLTLENRLIQAPLAGISCAPFRSLFSIYKDGVPAYAVTEMIPAQSLLQKSGRGFNKVVDMQMHKRYITKSPDEGRWCVQLSGYDPESLHRATLIANTFQPDLIDLNCGCPKPKVRRRGAGSALIESLTGLGATVRAMRQATSLPLTVKIRVAGSTEPEPEPISSGGADDCCWYLDAASTIEDSGADAVVVHGRHHSDNYDVPASYQQIRKVVNRLNIPVIANGDVRDADSLATCVQATGAAAVMIGRGSIGRPWLFQELLRHCNNSTPPAASYKHPGLLEVVEVFRRHIVQLADLEESQTRALLQARRLLIWYFPRLSSHQLTVCFTCRNVDELCYQLLNSSHDS